MIHSDLRNNWLESDDEHLMRDCEFTPFKSTGKGGQKKNKSSSAVRLTHRPTGIAVTGTNERCQHTNRKQALKKLRYEIAYNVRTNQETVQVDINLSTNNKRYFLWVAMIIDEFEKNNYALADSAAHFGISSSRLVKLIGRDPSLWQFINHQRSTHGQPLLKK